MARDDRALNGNIRAPSSIYTIDPQLFEVHILREGTYLWYGFCFSLAALKNDYRPNVKLAIITVFFARI